MKDSKVVFVCLYLCIFVFLGCGSLPKRDESASRTSSLLEPSATLKFSDVPVPAGFRFAPQESYSFESSGVRVGVLKYQGKADVEQVMNFYKEQMPMYNWSLLNVVEYGDRLINFERENETCIVTLSSKGNNIAITLSLGPRPQIAKKPKSTPK